MRQQILNRVQQFKGGVSAFLDKSVAQKAGIASRSKLTAVRDNRDSGKSVPHYAEQFESRHVGHPKIGNEQVWRSLSHYSQCFKPIAGSPNLVAIVRESGSDRD